MSEQSPFGRREAGEPSDRSARVILIGMGIVGVVLFLLFASPFSIFGGDDGEEPTDGVPTTGVSDGRAPGVPDGFQALSIHFDDLEQPANTEGPYALTMPLLEQVSDGRNLGLYTFTDGRWVRVSAATLVSNGTAASGEVDEMPANLAVLRLLESAVQLTGWLAPAAQPDGEALSVLTTINPAGYAPTPDGGVAGEARTLEGVTGNVVPSVRAGTPEEDEAVNAILASPALLEDHVTALVQLALQPGNAGVDIDYTRVNPARRADFTGFITVLAGQLHQANRTLSVALPAPVRSGVSWDTGAYDWEQIVEQADLVKLRPVEDPSLYFAAVDGALGYLGSQGVALNKVALIIGRESYERASDGLTALTLHDALTLASEIEVRTASAITPNSSVVIVGRNIFQDDGASGLVWNDEANAVSFDYPGRGGTRTVWLENSLSVAFKLELAAKYGLAGVAVSDVSDNPAQADFWEPLRTYSETGTISPAAANSVMLRPTWEVQAGNPQPEAKGNLVWTAPAQPGAYDISLVVSDGVIRASRSIQLNVQAPAPSP
jgi:spore germination protein YaaH